MIKLIVSDTFSAWLDHLQDRAGRARILDRLDRLAGGNFGDCASVGDGISELRMHFGPGYRAYFLQRGETLVVLLCGGDKRSQARDIKRAKVLAEDWKRS